MNNKGNGNGFNGLLGPDGQPLALQAEEVDKRFWARSPGEYEEAAERLLGLAMILKQERRTKAVEACRVACVLLAEVYVARTNSIVRR